MERRNDIGNKVLLSSFGVTASLLIGIVWTIAWGANNRSNENKVEIGKVFVHLVDIKEDVQEIKEIVKNGR